MKLFALLLTLGFGSAAFATAPSPTVLSGTLTYTQNYSFDGNDYRQTTNSLKYKLNVKTFDGKTASLKNSGGAIPELGRIISIEFDETAPQGKQIRVTVPGLFDEDLKTHGSGLSTGTLTLDVDELNQSAKVPQMPGVKTDVKYTKASCEVFEDRIHITCHYTLSEKLECEDPAKCF